MTPIPKTGLPGGKAKPLPSSAADQPRTSERRKTRRYCSYLEYLLDPSPREHSFAYEL